MLTASAKNDIKYSTMQGFNTGDTTAFKTFGSIPTHNAETASQALTVTHAPSVSAFRGGDRNRKSNKQSFEQLDARAIMERAALNTIQAQEQTLRHNSQIATSRVP